MSTGNPMTIGQKVAGSIGILVLLIAALGLVALGGFRAIKNEFQTAVNRQARMGQLSDDFEVQLLSMRAAQRGVLLYTIGKKPESVVSAKTAWSKSLNQASADLAELRAMAASATTVNQVSQAIEDLAKVNSLFREFEQQTESGNFDAAFEIGAKPLAVAFNDSVELSHQMAARQQELLKQHEETAAARAATSQFITVAVLLVSLGTGIAVLLSMHRTTKDLRRMTEELARGSEQVASAATEVSSSAQSLAQGASEQAASLEETSSSTHEITSMTSRNADNSKAAAALVVSATREIAHGNQKLDGLVASMQQINNSSDKISKIIKVIDEIAFQTNILALNAAVEAARAGEAGAGFAVVADEVRNLAQRSAQAAKDTAALIEESISNSRGGSTNLSDVTQSIATITEIVGKVSVLVEQVSAGSQEQAKGLDQIAMAISQMEEVTQKTAAVAEQSASAGEELSAQSRTLESIGQQLTALVGRDSQNAGFPNQRESNSRSPIAVCSPKNAGNFRENNPPLSSIMSRESI
jgi:methyl-accepting chemotaxis protein/methyl-accepting chemotaxis protein-1 (serine sensor receptor)